MHDPDPYAKIPVGLLDEGLARTPSASPGADPSPDLVWWLEDPVREAVRPGQPLALPMRLDEDGFEQLGLVHSLSRPL